MHRPAFLQNLRNGERWTLGFILGALVASVIAVQVHRASLKTPGVDQRDKKNITTPTQPRPKSERYKLRLASFMEHKPGKSS